MLPEYDLSRGVRSNHERAEAIRKYGYSVTVHHQDGTSTTQHFPPDSFMNDEKTYNWQGDRVTGDKVMGIRSGATK